MKKTIDVDSLFYNEDFVSSKEWHNEWHYCPTQRDHDERAQKPKHQKKFKKLQPDHLEVNGVILDRDCICSETGKEYKKGTKFKTNGHTRDAYWWAEYSGDTIPSKLRVKWKYVSSIGEVIKEYKMFDSPDDVELASDRLDGAYRDIFKHRGINITDGKLRKVEPIKFAAQQLYPIKYKEMSKTDVTNIRLWVSDLEDNILWLKNIFANQNFARKNHSYSKHINPFTLAYLVSYERYKSDPQKLEILEKFIYKVSNGSLTIIQDEFGEFAPDPDCPLNRFIEDWGMVKSNTLQTVFLALNDSDASNDSRSFCLLCIDKYVNGEKLTRLPKNWKKTLDAWFIYWQDEKARRKKVEDSVPTT